MAMCYVCSTLLSAGEVSSRTDRTIENVLDNFPKILYPPPIRVTVQLSVLQLPVELELSRLRNLVKTFQLHYRDFARKIAWRWVLCAMAENVGRISLRFLFELSTPRLVLRIPGEEAFTLALAYLVHRGRRRPRVECTRRVSVYRKEELKTAHTINHSIDIAGFFLELFFFSVIFTLPLPQSWMCMALAFPLFHSI